MRFLYDEPDALSPASITAIRTVIAAGALGVAILYKRFHDQVIPAILLLPNNVS